MSEEQTNVLSLLMISAWELWSSTLVGDRPASTEAMYHVLSNPQPGDLVLEISTRRDDPSRFGRLSKVVKEPVDGDWDEEVDGPRPHDTYWYVEDINGDEHRWYNCKFIRVLEHPIDPIQEAKSRNLVTPALARKLDEIERRVRSYTQRAKE